jgi:hypothetical protein
MTRRINQLVLTALSTAAAIPPGSRLGLIVMAVGLGLDVVVHLGPGFDHQHGTTSGPELSAHAVVFIGMALVLLGVVLDGVRPGRRTVGAVSGRRKSDAIR